MTKIYKLIHNGEIVYVGQTKRRLLSHRKCRGYGNTIPFYKDCLIELIEETDDVSREKYWIDKLRSEGHPLLNKRDGDTGLDLKEYQKEHYQKNKEKIKEYNKEYKEKNKEYEREYQKEYQKEYYEKNKEKIKEYNEKNKEKMKEYFKEYYLKRKDKVTN